MNVPSAWVLVVLALASFRVTTLVVDDWVPFGPIREWVWLRWPYGDSATGTETAERGIAVRPWWGRRVWAKAGPLIWSRFDDAAERAKPGAHIGQTRVGYLFTCPACSGVWVSAGWWVAWQRWAAGTLIAGSLAAVAGLQLLASRFGD